MIREIILSTYDASGQPHLAPMGLQQEGDDYLIQPFRPSSTLDYCLMTGEAVINYCDDVRVFAGCITGRRSWDWTRAEQVTAPRLTCALSHTELLLEQVSREDSERPCLHFRAVHDAMHRPFRGFNRAQSAVIEAAILMSRLGMLPQEKITQELTYLMIAMNKTAGPQELEAWNWLMDHYRSHRAAAPEDREYHL